MAKILRFPFKPRLAPHNHAQAEAQRKWLLANPDVGVAIKWDWPTRTWLSQRLEKVRQENVSDRKL